jgi:hypothetical protein
MDADRNGTKAKPGSNVGGTGAIHATEGLIVRIRAETGGPTSSSAVALLSRIQEAVESTADDRGYGHIPANGALAKEAEALLQAQFGKNWIQTIGR